MGLMTVYSSYWLIWSLRKTNLRWVQVMFLLCTIQNLNSFWIQCLSYATITKFHANHQYAQWIMFSIAVFLFYFTSNLMYWLFGYKYWVIAIEVPRLIAAGEEGKLNHKSICSEARYEALNWVGILVNLFFCLWTGWKRGVMDNASYFSKPSKQLGRTVMTLYTVITVLLVISACFLADALRRLKKSFNKDSRLVVN